MCLKDTHCIILDFITLVTICKVFDIIFLHKFDIKFWYDKNKMVFIIKKINIKVELVNIQRKASQPTYVKGL